MQSGYHEHGYAAAVILLLVATFESYVSRLRFLRPAAVTPEMRNATDVVFALYPRTRHRKALQDIYVLRDVLIHNHIWEIDYEFRGATAMVLHSAAKNAASGDRKFAARVNLNTYRTKALRLHIFPSRVDRTDILKVFDILWKILLVFENDDDFRCNVVNEDVRFRNQNRIFSEMRDEIRRTLR